MALQIYVAGPCLVKVNTGSEGALESLGYTVNGADVAFQDFSENVHTDENGGDAGPPTDILQHGEIAIVSLELARWDAAIADKVSVRARGATTVGQPVSAGTLMFQTGYEYRLLLHSPNNPFNFLRAFPRGFISVNKGTRHSRLVMTWECHKAANGYLFNAVTS